MVFLAWRQRAIQQEQDRLGLIPQRFAVRDILYAKEWSSGFGLSGGDNYGGVIVYALPQSTTREIQQQGLTYFRDLGQPVIVKDWGAVAEWQTTPIAPSREWAWEDRADANYPPPTLSGFLGRYGYPIDIDSEVAQDIGDSIAAPGSFLAYDRYGVLIVMPAKNKIAYAYRN
jgi:hypothetical protein